MNKIGTPPSIVSDAGHCLTGVGRTLWRMRTTALVGLRCEAGVLCGSGGPAHGEHIGAFRSSPSPFSIVGVRFTEALSPGHLIPARPPPIFSGSSCLGISECLHPLLWTVAAHHRRTEDAQVRKAAAARRHVAWLRHGREKRSKHMAWTRSSILNRLHRLGPFETSRSARSSHLSWVGQSLTSVPIAKPGWPA